MLYIIKVIKATFIVIKYMNRTNKRMSKNNKDKLSTVVHMVISVELNVSFKLDSDPGKLGTQLPVCALVAQLTFTVLVCSVFFAEMKTP